MKNLLILPLLIAALSQNLFAAPGKYDVNISYSNELRFRAGVDYKNIGIYARPVFSDERNGYYTATDQFVESSLKRKGAELGINVNKTLFAYKKMEVMVNMFGGFILSQVNTSGSAKYWERTADIGIIPEIRFFKKASITLAPYYFRYYWPNKEAINYSRSSGSYSSMDFLQMSVGFKFYY